MVSTIRAIRIAILIACHNRRENTIACLQSITTATLPINSDVNIYLVDDGSSDGTCQAVHQTFPQVKIIKGTGSLFWNRGMHLAWSIASKADYDFYIWLNDDTELFKDALLSMILASFSTNEQAIICGTTVSPTNHCEITYGGHNEKILVPSGHLQQCLWFNGNCVLVPKSVFQCVGNLDFIYRHSLGDVDYGFRAAKKGVLSYVAPNLIGICAPHTHQPKWLSMEISVFERIKSLYSPLGCPPFQFFVFSMRKDGYLMAIFQFINLHIRAVFPNLRRR